MTIHSVLEEIISILKQCAEYEHAAWLEERLLVLRDVNRVSEQARSKVFSELHGAVLGMGGLMDLVLRPSSSSRMSSTTARERLDVLSDRLYALTRDE